jgi:hypothetical protein
MFFRLDTYTLSNFIKLQFSVQRSILHSNISSLMEIHELSYRKRQYQFPTFVGSVLFDRLLFLRLNRLFTLLRVVGRSPGVSFPYNAILSGSAVNGKEDIIGGSLSIIDGRTCDEVSCDCDPPASAWLDWLASIAKYLG